MGVKSEKRVSLRISIYRQFIGAESWGSIDIRPSYHAEWVVRNSKKKVPPHTVTLHDLEELDDDLGARSDQDLTLAGLLGVVDGVEGIVKNGSADHFGGLLE